MMKGKGWMESYQVMLRDLKWQRDSKSFTDFSQSVSWMRMKSACTQARALHFASRVAKA